MWAGMLMKKKATRVGSETIISINDCAPTRVTTENDSFILANASLQLEKYCLWNTLLSRQGVAYYIVVILDMVQVGKKNYISDLLTVPPIR